MAQRVFQKPWFVGWLWLRGLLGPYLRLPEVLVTKASYGACMKLLAGFGCYGISPHYNGFRFSASTVAFALVHNSDSKLKMEFAHSSSSSSAAATTWILQSILMREKSSPRLHRCFHMLHAYIHIYIYVYTQEYRKMDR